MGDAHLLKKHRSVQIVSVKDSRQQMSWRMG